MEFHTKTGPAETSGVGRNTLARIRETVNKICTHTTGNPLPNGDASKMTKKATAKDLKTAKDFNVFLANQV